MNPFFNSPARITALQTTAAAWIGTPFYPNGAIQGHGVSCQKLVGRIYIESGWLPETFSIPDADMGWSNANTQSVVVEAVSSHPDKFAPLIGVQLVPGDLVGFKIGGCVHHLGIVVDSEGKFIHSLRGYGTTYSYVRDASFLSRLQNTWRPIDFNL